MLLTYLGLIGTGLLTGSFLNLVSDRLFNKKDFIFGRSKCEFCNKILSPLELIPVFSFLIQKGKCKNCGEKLSYLYPISEILTAISFALAFFISNKFNLGWAGLIYYLIGFSLFLIIFFSDYKYYEIPFEIVVIGSIFSLVYRYFILKNLSIENFNLEAFSLFGIFVFFYLIIFLSRGGMGGGDLKLSVFISLFIGFPENINAIYYSFVVGGIFALFLLVTGKKGLKAKIPFGPFMILGVLLSLLI